MRTLGGRCACGGGALALALAALASTARAQGGWPLSGVGGHGKGRFASGQQGKPMQQQQQQRAKPPPWDPNVTKANSKVCKVMAPLWLAGRRALGDSTSKISDKDCSLLHEYYMGPHFHPQLTNYGYKVPADCLGYVGIYKSASTETLCNLRNKFGKRKRWAQGMGMNMLQRMIQIHMFPVLNESAEHVEDPKQKYYEDSPGDLARAEREGRPRHGTGFTWVRDPAHRFVSGYSEIEYYLTVGEPYFFKDIVLHSPKEREMYKPGTMANQAKAACFGCSFYNLEVASITRAKRFVLDLLSLGMRPNFLWRHIFAQVAQANTFSRSAGPLDFVAQLESFDRGWDYIGMLTNAQMDHFNRSCRGHDYSGTSAGFKPRDAMHTFIFGAKKGSPEAEAEAETCSADGSDAAACQDGGGGASVIAKSLGCALLLPDYVCFGYKNIVTPQDCVDGGYANSTERWEKVEKYIRKYMCPNIRRFIGGLRDSGPIDQSTVKELFTEKRSSGM